MSRPGVFSRDESNEPAGSTLGGDGTAVRCIVTNKSSLARATVVTDDEPCHFFFGQVCKNERTGILCTVYMSEIRDTTMVDFFVDCIRMVSHVDYGTRLSVHEANNFLIFLPN